MKIFRLNIICFSFLFLCWTINSYGQRDEKSPKKKAYVDSLYQSLSNVSDASKTAIYFELLKGENNVGAIRHQYAKEAIAFAQKTSNKALEIYAGLQTSLLLINKGSYQEAAYYLQKANRYYAVQQKEEKLVTTLILQGFNYQQQQLTSEALSYYLKALPLAESISDLKRINNLYNRIVQLYTNKKDYKKAIHYASFIEENCKNEPENCPFQKNRHQTLARIYIALDELDSARHYTYIYFRKMSRKRLNSEMQIGYKRMAELRKAEGNFTEAILYADSSMLVAKKLNRRRAIVAIHEFYASVYRLNGEATKAVHHLNFQKRLAEQYEYLGHQKAALEQLWKIYSGQKDFEKSELYAEQWRMLVDSISEIERLNVLKRQDEIISQYKQQEKIQSLEKEQIVQQNRTTFLWIITASLLTILVISFYFLRNRKLLNASLKEKNQLLNNLVAERNTLLKEIHHRVKNNLQIISSMLNLQMRHVKSEEAKSVLADGRNRVRSIAMIHQNLYQETDFKSIKTRKYILHLLENIQATFRNNQVELIAEVEDCLLTEESMTQIGLIINEIITNAFKHAFEEGEKGEIKLHFYKDREHLKLEVKDNGKGIPVNFKMRENQSFGLQLIEDFGVKLKAKFRLEPRKVGTFFQMIIPLEKDK